MRFVEETDGKSFVQVNDGTKIATQANPNLTYAEFIKTINGK